VFLSKNSACIRHGFQEKELISSSDQRQDGYAVWKVCLLTAQFPFYIPSKANGYLHEGADVCLANKQNGGDSSSVSRHITICLVWDVNILHVYMITQK
jgi:hypothetical protein